MRLIVENLPDEIAIKKRLRDHIEVSKMGRYHGKLADYLVDGVLKLKLDLYLQDITTP